MQPLIDMRSIVKSYVTGEVSQTVLKEVDLIIHPGEQVAIMGASGSGKSTLMNIIGLLDRPTSGNYFINGKDVTTLTEDERVVLRNQAIGFVFQSFFLLPRLNILDNVSLPLYYRGVAEKEMRERALQILERVGLAHLWHHRPNQLSGGQQQRAAIARALVGNPTFLLADEPTGALDSKTGQLIMDLFSELNQKEHATILIITHDGKVAAQCQRTEHIADGKFIRQTT